MVASVEPTANEQYLHAVAVIPLCLLAKLKSDENGHALNVASDTLSCFVDMFLHFFRKGQLVSLTLCFISKINYKKEN